MAMNKKEQQVFNDLQIELARSKALTLGDEVSPDVKAPSCADGFEALTTGYFYNSYSRIVTKGCSSSTAHSLHKTDSTQSQGAAEMYSSEYLALKAMRYEIAARAADELREIDNLIEQAWRKL